MKKRPRSSYNNIFEIFSDVSLLMLATFIFLLVTILITARMAEEYQMPRLKSEIKDLQEQLKHSNLNNNRLMSELDDMSGMSTDVQMDRVLETAGLGQGQGRRDFDLFIQGLKDLPGRDLHILVDATGSMHGVTNFLIPVLRVIVIRSDKHLDAITWFSGDKTETYTGSMGEMFDKLMQGAPFIGSDETIGDAFKSAARNAKVPGAYLLIGDEPSDDRIYYLDIPAPAFTLPLGRENPTTTWEYKKLAEKTGGKMLRMDIK